MRGMPGMEGAVGAGEAPPLFCTGGITRGMPFPGAVMEPPSPAPRMLCIILLISGMEAAEPP